MTQIRLTGPCIACDEIIMTQVFLSVSLPFSPLLLPSLLQEGKPGAAGDYLWQPQRTASHPGRWQQHTTIGWRKRSPSPMSRWLLWTLSDVADCQLSLSVTFIQVTFRLRLLPVPVILFLQAKSKSLSSLTALATVGVLAFCSPPLGDTGRTPGTSPALTNLQAPWLEPE